MFNLFSLKNIEILMELSVIIYSLSKRTSRLDGSYAITLLTLKQQCIRQTDSREVLFDRLYHIPKWC
jgi:uncharacterized protein Smg (DUF494 family)